MKFLRKFFILLTMSITPLIHARSITSDRVKLSLNCAVRHLNRCCVAQADLTQPSCAGELKSCGSTNSNCTLDEDKLKVQMNICNTDTFSVRDRLAAKKLIERGFECPVRDQTEVVASTAIAAGGMSTLVVVLRIVAQQSWLGGRFGWDDCVISFAGMLMVFFTSYSIFPSRRGLGMDIWDMHYEHIQSVLRLFYLTELLYVVSITLTKISILLFYLRIFPDRSLRHLVHYAIWACVVYGITFIPTIIWQCIPVHYVWHYWDGIHKGTCSSATVHLWVSSCVNILLNIVVICIPLRELSKLSLSWMKRAGIMVLFSGGGFIVIVSIVRIRYLILFEKTNNPTWDYTPIGYWTTIEVHVGVILACLPVFRAFSKRIVSLVKHHRRRNVPSPTRRISTSGCDKPLSLASSRKGTIGSTPKNPFSLRTHNNTIPEDKDFIPLNELSMGGPSTSPVLPIFFRGGNETRIHCGPAPPPTAKTARRPPPISQLAYLPPELLRKGSPFKRWRPVPDPAPAPAVITVQREYTVTRNSYVERENEATAGSDLGARSASQSSGRGVPPMGGGSFEGREEWV
ncbi:hypothetical protein BDV95DRAFT_39967 [Massariosphaeria phaeospora]|uniref:Rhodopsin domain-containing protein n=1 Tax=Massariosphaeria phaeospora TaxID=100035 RepID=A0A7C8I5L3_9PLEO|nr:hypothetical protein BDV95DRAFT_39967 [Massariosphaeria phaeospora]